jgi:hypothetical protein
MRPRIKALLCAFASILLIGASVSADDGELLRKSMSRLSGNPVLDPVPEAEHAFIRMLPFYVPAQASNGSVLPIDYFNADEALVDTRSFAKPLIGVYIFGPVEGVEGVGFVGHGKREAYGAVSLDDGTTWKSTDLSESADETSCDGSGGGGGCNVVRDDIELFADTSYAYPGDVINIFHGSDGRNVLVAWPSRYCSAGQPNYSLPTSNPARLDAIAAYLGIDLETPSPDDLYLTDMYGVAGQQGSIDYGEDRFEQNQPVGEVPFACLWTARGVLVEGDDPRTTEASEASYLRWFKAERLTSGRRDVNRIETVCVAGAGCAITWQEDPEGLRPGQGEGPGEGWSGAIANSQTDVWYSYIPWASFDLVQDETDATNILTFQEFLDAGITTKPQVGIPMAMPMRVTDNARCNVANPAPYCNGSAIQEEHPAVLNPLEYGLKDMCADTTEIPTGPQNTPSPICVTEDGLPLVGNIAATRPRLGLYGYSSSNNPNDPIDSAFAVFVAEESKGLGRFGFTETGEAGAPCDPDEDEGCIAFDEGKNVWFYSFSMALDDRFADDPADGLVANLAGHGNMLNQPEVDWTTGEFYPVRNTADLWDFGDYNYEIWNTEIARRGSLLAQDIENVNVRTSKAKAGLIALPTWKQGIMNQGGPADVMARRIIIPRGWTVQRGNPYAFRNLACGEWLYGRSRQGVPENPYYPDGLCMDSAINVSGYIPDTCTDSQLGGDVPCPQVDLSQATTFGIGDTNPILQGRDVTPNTTKVLSWHQCPAAFTTVSSTDGLEVKTCENDLRTDASTLADQSWYNPLDVAKGHRGFLDGDFVMILYGWSPNWRTNAVGNDRYELYVRRSFDGAESWTTLPGKYKHWDNVAYSGEGTTTCETFRSLETGGGDVDEPRTCNAYAAGAFEQARNVTQHKSMRITTLDPRYAPTAKSIVQDPFLLGIPDPDGEDLRNPSRFFIVYETGDNTTAAEGEPEPLDLFYSRAVAFGDHYQVWAEEDDLSVCYPSTAYDTMPEVAEEVVGSGFCNEFDQLEQGSPGLEASEASLVANPGGEFLYGAWAQLLLEEFTGDVEESDAMARRVWWIDDYIPTDAWTLGGGSTP